MGCAGKKDSIGLREIGLRLANFRKKLAMSMGQRKLIQSTFGQMYGGYSGRAIASYELGDVDPPASLLYLLWQNGHSIDALFADGQITEKGRETAVKLYENTTTARLAAMDLQQRERVYREVISHAKKDNNGATKETAPRTSRKRKRTHSAPRRTKKG